MVIKVMLDRMETKARAVFRAKKGFQGILVVVDLLVIKAYPALLEIQGRLEIMVILINSISYSVGSFFI
jgi:hypothetical protein